MKSVTLNYVNGGMDRFNMTEEQANVLMDALLNSTETFLRIPPVYIRPELIVRVCVTEFVQESA